MKALLKQLKSAVLPLIETALPPLLLTAAKKISDYVIEKVRKV